ncbi:aconitate hydratase, partial [bacterium]
GKATITNMGAELGATCSIFPYDERMSAYLKITNRSEIAALAQENKDILTADAEVAQSPEKFFDQVIEIDLSDLEPHLVGPHSPDIAHPISTMAATAKANGWPMKLSAALIGSCTNSSYEDIGRAAFIAKQALANGVKMSQQFIVTPGSTQIQNTIERDGYLTTFNEVGATMMANACGPCIGQWKRETVEKGTVNTIVTSFNRNFRGRQDDNPETLAFIGSPELVMALGVAGRIDFNPIKDEITAPNGTKFKLEAPVADELPRKGFVADPNGYQSPAGASAKVAVSPTSDRLQLLEPFGKWDGKDSIDDLLILCKAKGKCTTDHISPAGKWLKYRGHLDNISNNMLLGATNAFTNAIGQCKNVLTGETKEFAQVA